MPESHTLLVTCEHAGRLVPAPYRRLFRGREALLASHRGWDPGALCLARALAKALGAPLLSTRVTRLVVDCNRSSGHPRLFSERTRALPGEAKASILARHYSPYRSSVCAAVETGLLGGARVLHLSVHTFVPVLGGVPRGADIGLLYDPGRPEEARFCARLRSLLLERGAGWKVRRNYPYRGTADGLATWLRRVHGPRYLGVELEVNQGLRRGKGRAWRHMRGDLIAALRAIAAPGRGRLVSG